MNRLLILLMTCLVTAAAFAGCHEPEAPVDGDGTDGADGTDGTDGGAKSITLTVTDAPTTVRAGEAFNVTVQVEADGTVTSSHFGAHYGQQSSADAEPSQYTTYLNKTSPHTLEETQIGESYTISGWSFSADEVGTIYFRAHVRTADGDFWGDEEMIIVTAE